jgi:putative lipoprotein
MRQDEERQKDGVRRALLAAPAVLLAGAAVAQPGPGEIAMIRGTAAYRERMALPPGAVLEVRLEDVSRADAPAELLASATIVTDRQVPIPFALA